MPQVLFQIGRASRTGVVQWTSIEDDPNPISVLPNEQLFITGNINPPQLTDVTKKIFWRLFRSATPLDEASWLQLAGGQWRGGVDAVQPSINIPAEHINGFYLRGRATITHATTGEPDTINFGLTIETRVIT